MTYSTHLITATEMQGLLLLRNAVEDIVIYAPRYLAVEILVPFPIVIQKLSVSLSPVKNCQIFTFLFPESHIILFFLPIFPNTVSPPERLNLGSANLSLLNGTSCNFNAL